MPDRLGAGLERLALAIDDDTVLGPARALLSVDVRTARAAFDSLGQTVLLYRREGGKSVLFIGRGRVAAVETGADDSRRRLRIEEVRRFEVSVPGESERGAPGIRRLLRLSGERFDEIVATGGASPWLPGAAEARPLFVERDAPSLQTYLAIHDLVLERWGYRCAFTDRQFEAAAARPHPGLQVVAIRPREQGGPLHVRNYLPMVAEAAGAWRRGEITLGNGHEFWVAKDRLDPELEEQLRPLGRLVLPERREDWPDPEQIRFHREQIFAR